MGGNLAWTIRLEDGVEYRMDRSTNIFPGIVTDAFLAGDKAALDRALAPWIEMKDDWEKNRETGNFEFNMSGVYAPYPFGLRPSEYGFIVVDFVSKCIVSCQRYSPLFVEHVSSEFAHPERLRTRAELVEWQASIDAKFVARNNGSGVEPDFDDLSAFTAQARYLTRNAYTMLEGSRRLRALFDSGRVQSFNGRDERGRGVRKMAGNITWAEFLKTDIDPVLGCYVYLSPPVPWVIHEFSANKAEERRQALSAAESLGFSLSAEERADFATWIESQVENELQLS